MSFRKARGYRNWRALGLLTRVQHRLSDGWGPWRYVKTYPLAFVGVPIVRLKDADKILRHRQGGEMKIGDRVVNADWNQFNPPLRQTGTVVETCEGGAVIGVDMDQSRCRTWSHIDNWESAKAEGSQL